MYVNCITTIDEKLPGLCTLLGSVGPFTDSILFDKCAASPSYCLNLHMPAYELTAELVLRLILAQFTIIHF